MPLDLLPDFALTAEGPMTQLAVSHGIASYRTAARQLHLLPYGRNSDRARPELVLAEGRGTCSTKHALLAAIAAEHEEPVELWLGFYEMSERNTPGVGAVLARHGLDSVPEAHCYLRYHRSRIDLTRQVAGAVPFTASLIAEERIVPEQIGEYKVALHRRTIERWIEKRSPGWSVEEVWRVRERCIDALGKGECRRSARN